MGTYFNPSSLQTPNNYKANGPLGGFLAGMNQDYANQITNQNIQEGNLDIATKQQLLDLANATQGDKISESHYTGTKADADKARIDSGDYAAVQAAKDAASKAADAASTVGSNVQGSMAAIPLIQQFSGEARAKAANFNPMDRNDISWWQGWKQKLVQAGATQKMPDAPSPGDLQKAIQWSDSVGQSAQNSIPQLQALQKINAEGSNQLGVAKEHSAGGLAEAQERSKGGLAEAQAHADAARYTADKGYDKSTEVARIQAEAVKDARTNYYNKINLLMEKNNGTIPDYAVPGLRLQAHQMEREAAAYKLQILGSFQDTAKRKEAYAQADEQADSDLDAVLSMGKGGSGKAAPASAAPVKPISTKADYDALQPGASYVDARDGKTKVKGK